MVKYKLTSYDKKYFDVEDQELIKELLMEDTQCVLLTQDERAFVDQRFREVPDSELLGPLVRFLTSKKCCNENEASVEDIKPNKSIHFIREGLSVLLKQVRLLRKRFTSLPIETKMLRGSTMVGMCAMTTLILVFLLQDNDPANMLQSISSDGDNTGIPSLWANMSIASNSSSSNDNETDFFDKKSHHESSESTLKDTGSSSLKGMLVMMGLMSFFSSIGCLFWNSYAKKRPRPHVDAINKLIESVNLLVSEAVKMGDGEMVYPNGEKIDKYTTSTTRVDYLYKLNEIERKILDLWLSVRETPKTSSKEKQTRSPIFELDEDSSSGLKDIKLEDYSSDVNKTKAEKFILSARSFDQESKNRENFNI